MPKPKPIRPIVESLAIGVPTETLWAAITSPRVIGDIVMGHVEIHAKPGEPFTWEWGVWKKAAPGKGSHAWRGTVLDAVPGSTLVLGSDDAAVTLTVKGQGSAALITVVHAASRAPAEDYQYGWADFLLKLKTLLERNPAASSLYLRTLVRAKPAEVLRAWTSAAVMSKLLPGKAKIQPRPGGAFDWRWSEPEGLAATGTILEIVKGHRVAFTWRAGMLAGKGNKSVLVSPQQRFDEVRLAAEETPYGALVSLEHTGLPPGRLREQRERMWAHLLERMRVYFYFGKKIRT
ncbi:MAG TPA: SRPBCC family protein [Candidatus Nitrosotenuis sp.]|nr:SRPBCC family protein [Candidatus Nitrosotenuis sp.]